MENFSNKKNLYMLWLAQAISQAGDAIYQLALLWLILDLTSSSIITGLIAMCAYLPALIFGLFSGVFSDRMNRYWLLIFANAGQALTTLLIPIILWYSDENIWLICGLAFLRSSFNTLFQPAFHSFIPMLFPLHRLVRINAILATSGQIAWVMGPFFAGILLTLVSIPKLFIVDGVSFLVAICFLFWLKKPYHLKKLDGQSHLAKLKDGLSYIFEDKPIFWMIVITFINNLFIMGPAIVGLPILVKINLSGTASDFAFIEGCMAAGALVGSLMVSKLNQFFKNGTIWAIGLFVDGITYSFLYWVQNIEMTMVIIFLHGIGIPFIIVSRTSIIQIHIPNKFHGRLFSIVHLGVVGTTAISSLLVGVITSIISVKLLFYCIGCMAALCGVFGITMPTLRDIQ